MSIPIVSADGRLVGWTDRIPQIVGSALRHPEAEQLVGGSVVALYIELDQPGDVVKAGAPPGWKGAWRCLALCSELAAKSGRLPGGSPPMPMERKG
jgi:hypothetical protein